MPATGPRAPARILVAVRAMVPVTGVPPDTAAAMLATPCATSSLFERWRRPDMPSATTADSSDSIAPRMAIANASGSTARIFSRLKGGIAGAGIPDWMTPKREPMVSTFRPSRNVSRVAPATAISNAGQFGRSRRTIRIAAIENADMATVAGLTVPIAAQSAVSFGKVSAGSLTSVSPNRSRACEIRMMTAMPAVNPTVTG
jgi:hypothetical protein